jgi:hypothetical protein
MQLAEIVKYPKTTFIQHLADYDIYKYMIGKAAAHAAMLLCG